MDQAENEKGLSAAFGASDALMECLRTNIEMGSSMSDGGDELIE
jgi:hypothetical protein